MLIYTRMIQAVKQSKETPFVKKQTYRSINILSIKISDYTHTQCHIRPLYTFTGNME